MPLSKSDFQLFRDSPLHLWAKKHAQYQEHPSAFAQHLSQQGYQVEALAIDYLKRLLETPTKKLLTQQTFHDGEFDARVDGLLYDQETDSYELYEVKSGTSEQDQATRKTKDHHLYDATFQALILERQLKLTHVYLVDLNKEYVRQGELEPSQMFNITLIDEPVALLKAKVLELRQRAFENMSQAIPNYLEPCVSPTTCPCLSLCHPVLPENSIYDISGLWGTVKKELRSQGILKIQDIPADFQLQAKQRTQVEVTKSGKPIIRPDLIRHELEQLTSPLYFLDYETYNAGIPMYDGYHPYGHMVFQFSLDVLEQGATEFTHYEHVVTGSADPSREICEQLKQYIGPVGSIITWNSSFEGGCNTHMAERYSEHRDFLLDVNERLYDLGDVFKYNNMYVLPEFKGSWSIKNVLPVIVPELSYKELDINKGDIAMQAWFHMTHQVSTAEEKAKIKADLLKYCGLDTLAMVEIWKRLVELTA